MLEALADEFREEASRLRQWGAADQAATLEAVARRLEERLAEWLDEPLTPQEAAAETGFKAETIAKRIASGKLPNAGRRYRPRVRRRDLYSPRNHALKVELPTPVEQLLDEVISNCE